MSEATRPRREKECVAFAVNHAGARVRCTRWEAPVLGRIVGYKVAAGGEYDDPNLIVEFDEPTKSFWCANHLDPEREILTAPLRFPDDWGLQLYSKPGRLLLIGFPSETHEVLELLHEEPSP